MRVIFDTNILVSAFTLPGGSADTALTRVIEGADQLLISRAIIDELLGVLARKFSRDREELARVAVILDEIAELIRPKHSLQVLADGPDNRILECAVEGRADVVVTDRAMLLLRWYADVHIISLREYLTSK